MNQYQLESGKFFANVSVVIRVSENKQIFSAMHCKKIHVIGSQRSVRIMLTFFHERQN